MGHVSWGCVASEKRFHFPFSHGETVVWDEDRCAGVNEEMERGVLVPKNYRNQVNSLVRPFLYPSS